MLFELGAEAEQVYQESIQAERTGGSEEDRTLEREQSIYHGLSARGRMLLPGAVGRE